MTIDQSMITAMFEEETLDGLLVLLTISHSSLPIPIRIVNDTGEVHRHSTTDSAEDSTSNANTPVFTGTPTYVTGINANASGKALNFEPEDHLDFGSGTEFDLDSFTIEFWIKPETIRGSVVSVFDDNAMVGRDVASTKGFRFGYDKDGRIKFFATSSGGTFTVEAPLRTLEAGKSTHVAITYNGAANAGSIIINGATIATGTGTIVIPVGEGLKLNGTWVGGSNADATYDEVRIWDIPRGAGAIFRDMNRRLLGTERGLVGYWPWSEPLVFVGIPFVIQLPTDEAGSSPSAKLEIDNTSREITAAIRAASVTSPEVQIDVVRILDQDAVELTFPPLNLKNVRATVDKISGDLFSEDLMIDPYPNDRFTPGFFPGLF